MKKLDDPKTIIPSSMFFCPENHYISESSDYIGKGFKKNELEKIDLIQKIEDIFYCSKCNKLYTIKELKR